MNFLLQYLLAPASLTLTYYAITLIRIGIGILTIGHGIPKIMGGIPMWRELGMYVAPIGIHFLPVMWGFLAAITEFFGGIMLVAGFGTRIASAALVFMMWVAFMWHINHGDPYNIYSFPLSLLIVYGAFLLIGGGPFSVDGYITKHW